VNFLFSSLVRRLWCIKIVGFLGSSNPVSNLKIEIEVIKVSSEFSIFTSGNLVYPNRVQGLIRILGNPAL
jgi:hypothetical protein